MSRREIGCSARGMTRGSTIAFIVPKSSPTRLNQFIVSNLAPWRAYATIPDMPRDSGRALVVMMLMAVGTAAASAGPKGSLDPIAHARTLYNERQFDAAVTAAEEARLIPGRADSADLIAARAYL